MGPDGRTLRSFVGSYHDLLHAVSDALIPSPTAPRETRADYCAVQPPSTTSTEPVTIRAAGEAR